MTHIDKQKVPKQVSRVTSVLQDAGFEAHVVGGCVRDLLLGRDPKDWDITTNANPEQIQGLFEHTVYENIYGTVRVINDGELTEALRVIEVTPYRLESSYSDHRHPDEVIFSNKIEDDLTRRDLTINAIAYDPIKDTIVDPHKGQDDLINKTVRAVGNAKDRITEDHLRILRAIRIANELDFSIESKTQEAIVTHETLLADVSAERIRDELVKIVLSPAPARGIEMAHRLGVWKYIIPELEEGIGNEQNGDHIYDVWVHNLKALQHAADENWPLHIRLGALLHDVGKPKTRRWSEEKNDWTFYGHDVVGARQTAKIMARLRFSRETSDIVTKLVRHHLFFSDVEKITLSAVRRIVVHIGKEHIWDLVKVRFCDRIGMGRPKAEPFRLRKYESMIEEVLRDPITVGMLKVDGNILLKELGMKPGPRIGWILHALLEDVLEDPARNTKEYLVSRVTELEKLNDTELKIKGEVGRDRQHEAEEYEIKKIRKKYRV
ncbi:MAG: HD domain-containing protein [bacterium]|nr:HD domain-containing protein [bacterium]